VVVVFGRVEASQTMIYTGRCWANTSWVEKRFGLLASL
jgi:hypothetical protein